MEAALFDLDDTLVNSNDIHIQATQLLFEKKGWTLPSFTPEEQASFLGEEVRDILQIIINKAQIKANIDQLNEERNGLFLQLVQSHLQLLPGALSAIEACRQAGLKVAIASSGLRSYINKVVQKFSIEVDSIISADDVKKGKPDPEIYLTAAAHLGIPPPLCIVFEDSQNGLLAGKRAGCYCIAIPNIRNAKQDLSAADLTIPTLEKVTSEFLRNI